MARAQKIGTTVRYRGSFTLGSTSAVTGTIIIPLPHEAHASYTVNSQIGFGTALDFGTRLYGTLAAVLGNTTSFTLRVVTTVSGTNPVFTEVGSGRALNASTPIAFGNQDEFNWFVEYESAA